MPELLSPSKYDEWDAFVKESKGGTIFHTSWYLSALADEVRIYVLRDKKGLIEAGMAITPIRFLGTTAARRPAWTAYNGPLIRNSSKEKLVDRVSEEKTLLLRLLTASPRMGMYDYILSPKWTDMMPFIWNGFETSVGYTYQIPPATPEEWQSAMSSSHRRDLRKGVELMKKAGGTIETGASFGDCYSLVCDTFQTKEYSVRADQQVLQRWWDAVVRHNTGTSYIARDADGQAVCATILIFDDNRGYYLASGIRADARRGPMNLWSRVLIDRMIGDTHKQGLTFDFEGSVLPGVERFFRGWGGQCVPKYRAVKIVRPWTYAAWTLHRYWTRHRKKTWFTV